MLHKKGQKAILLSQTVIFLTQINHKSNESQTHPKSLFKPISKFDRNGHLN